MKLKPCECEHSAHFNIMFTTPNGNPAHGYGKEFNEQLMHKVQTPYGEYHVCLDCATDCLLKYTV